MWNKENNSESIVLTKLAPRYVDSSTDIKFCVSRSTNTTSNFLQNTAEQLHRKIAVLLSSNEHPT